LSGPESGGQVIIDVSDDGPGVPPDQLPHIFERFYRGGARSRRPGSGLGLAIAAEIVSAHGGTASAEPAAREACGSRWPSRSTGGRTTTRTRTPPTAS
jgi:signal transduction histidine kinase